MKTKRELEIKEKKIRKALLKEERRNFKKRYLLLGIIIVLIAHYFINLNLTYKSYLSYNDSQATEKYNQIIQNFNNLDRYHLQYKTSLVRGSVDMDIFYIKNKLYLEKSSEDNEIEIQIYVPGRSEMNLDKEEDSYTFSIGSPIENKSIPVNIDLEINQSMPSSGKIYLTEKNLSGEKIFCFETKEESSFVSQYFLFGAGKYFPKSVRFLQDLPKKVEASNYQCYTEQGVLVRTIKSEKFGFIEYNFTNDFLSELPLYSDFQKFSNISMANRAEYFKISIGNITTYFHDFNNYATFGSFDKKEYFTSGCFNGTSLSYSRPCDFDISYSQEWANYSYYPLVYLGSRIIANETSYCFNYSSIEKEFCIIPGGYMVSESFVWQNKTVGYEVTSILNSSEKEFNKEMEKAVYLSSLN